MIIVQINQTYKIGSTGRIMYDLDKCIKDSGHKSYMVAAYSGSDRPSNLYVTERLNHNIAVRKNILISRITGIMGYRQRNTTQKMIEWIDSKKPDVIHLHNIHGDWLNLKILFTYLKRKNIKVIWTLHDCWSFTGRCSHFELCSCEKWKTECYKCTNNKVYPITYFFDFSKEMFRDKKRLFSGIDNMILVTPSIWLSKFISDSFLSEYPVKVINNGIDLNVFYPRKTKSKYLERCENKTIILGVASSWTELKGLNDFYRLNEVIDHSKYQIVLVGLNQRQFANCPKDIIGVKRTDSVDELAELYSNADVFINPTYQDNFPTTNLESLACGTPVVTYETGGSVESIDGNVGVIANKNDINSLKNSIIKAISLKSEDCTNKANKNFDKAKKFNEYINLYQDNV